VRIDGILNVNKPPAMTSFQVVSIIRQWSNERRVGHAGTLDPFATGVLPVCLGQGTRVAEFLTEGNKTYRAAIELGTSTDTYDLNGRVIERCDASGVTREQVEIVLTSFRGPILQIPPMYSALKRGGKRLYQMARAGIEVPREARNVELLRLELLDWQPPLFTLEVECSKGTYIRSLAHDIGQALGCGSHLRSLVRTKNGPFYLEDSIPLSDLEEAFRDSYWHDLIYPMDFVLTHWKAAILGEASEHALQRGQSLPFAGEDGPSRKDGGHRCRAYTLDGRIFALLRWDAATGLWHPDKVFQTGSFPPS